MDISSFLYYGSIFFIVGLTSLGTGIGGGKATVKTLDAINRAPTSYPEIFRAIIIGLALIETSAILGIVMALLLIVGQPLEAQENIFIAISQWGIAFSLGITGCLVGILSALPAQEAAYAIARQPFFSSKILNTMLLTQSIIQTPVIFSFLIALFIKAQFGTVSTYANSIRLLASGLCMGLGSIGPTIGLARFAQVANRSISINRNAYSLLMPFTFISQAIIETPIIFAVLISIILLITPVKPHNEFLGALACLATAFCIALGTLGPGIGSGKIASAACKEIALAPENNSLISRTSILGQGIIDAAAMYALLVALIIIVLR